MESQKVDANQSSLTDNSQAKSDGVQHISESKVTVPQNVQTLSKSDYLASNLIRNGYDPFDSQTFLACESIQVQKESSDFQPCQISVTNNSQAKSETITSVVDDTYKDGGIKSASITSSSKAQPSNNKSYPGTKQSDISDNMDSSTTPALAGESVQLHNKSSDSQPSQSSVTNNSQAKSGTVNNQLTRDREERLRLLKEKQNEERLKKLEELRQQALIAKKFREQKEEERRRRIEELRMRDNDRRQQVEERKRQIWEVERDRREAILRKNQEREARIEMRKKNERSSLIFAFGSSTPRMLEPADTGGSYWASRRATSTTNVMSMSLCGPPPGPLTRRSSERELSDGNKKRAISAGGLLDYRKQDGDEFNTVPKPFRTAANRRKTDLMPTIPSPRETRNPPGRAYSMSRLDVLSHPRPQLSPTPRTPRLTSSKSVSSLAQGQRTLGKNENCKSMLNNAPIPPPRPTRAERLRKKAKEAAKSHSASGSKSGETTPSRPTSSMSQTSSASSVRTRPQAMPRRPRPISIAGTGVSSPTESTSSKQSLSSEHRKPATEKSPLPKVHGVKKAMQPKQSPDNQKKTSAKSSQQSSVCSTPALQSPTSDMSHDAILKENVESNNQGVPGTYAVQAVDNEEGSESRVKEVVESKDNLVKEPPVKTSNVAESNVSTMSESSQASQEEAKAKAALAERRRLARIQMEKEAEEERLRQENQRLAELEALRKEEEEQRKLEEEQRKLEEEAKKAEEQRLMQAIEEAQRHEEEERKRKEEELRQKLEKEEQERKAKEDAENLRELARVKQQKEQEDRQKRKQRVEAILQRTRMKNAPGKEDGDNSDGDITLNHKNSPSDNFSDDSSQNKLQTPPSGLTHTNGHHNGLSEKNTEQNVVSNAVLDSHDDKAVDLLNLSIPTIMSNENNVSNVNFTNS